LLAVVGSGIYLLTAVGGGDGDYGSMRIPSARVVHLPAGRVDMTFTMDLTNQTVDIPVLRIGLEPEGGGRQLVVTHEIGSAVGINGVTHDVVAWTDVPAEGDYRVAVDGADPSEPNPQLLFGPPDTSARIGFPVLGAGALLLVIGIVLGVRKGRRSRTVSDAVTGPRP
jgi:hypothetical protein